jgi:16S rRNA (uracil1498-N3)-methyltransferase
MTSARYRIATDQRLSAGATLQLEGNAAHYLSNVLRLTTGDAVALFNRADGEWQAVITDIRKKVILLRAETCTRPPAPMLDFTVCFAPIKGGRLETIIEKATELGAAVLQPVITSRTIVDKVNIARADAIAREAAEQCERIDWPEIREPVKLEKLLGQWPSDTPLYYGDETGGGMAITELSSQDKVSRWGILAGPEGGFTPDELTMLRHCKAAVGVGLGPRILRADTAIITLSALTLAAFGDWHQKPRFDIIQ